MHDRLHSTIRTRERGFGLVEIMVGVTIGLLALLIVYQVLGLAEGYRRTTTAGGDALSSGMISSFVLAGDIANSGHTISESGAELASCPSTGVFATTWRPIPVLITDGGCDACSDSFALFGGNNRRLVSSLDIMADYIPGGPVTVQSPMGFHRTHPTEAPHMFVMVDTIANVCEVRSVSPWPLAGGTLHHPTSGAGFNDVTGIVSITPSPGPFGNTYPQGQSWVVNLGPNDRVRKAFYDVAGDVLRRTDLMTAAPPNPVASNITLIKAQYGIDTDADQFIDTWVRPDLPPWTAANVLVAPLAQLKQIKAIRLAVVVRSTQFERPTDAEGRAQVTNLTADFTHTFFNCNGLLPCTGEMPNVTIPGTANYRYRVFEQVIPLTNQIWNPT